MGAHKPGFARKYFTTTRRLGKGIVFDLGV
jgi:hypothetical protein